MNCNDVQTLIHAYVDGELDLVRSLEIEQHMHTCPACMQLYKSQQALRTALSTQSLYYKAPPHLQKQIQASIRQTSKDNSVSRVQPWQLLSIAAVLTCVALLIGSLVYSLSLPNANERLAQEVFSSHMRSLMATQQADVRSSDQHTVKPWFNGKLDFAPVVEDLSGQGFPLIGGRLDYLDNRPVAALVYRRQQHSISLFSWHSTNASERAMQTELHQGYQLVHWTQAGMNYWAVSDLNMSELQLFAKLHQRQTLPTPAR